MDPNYQTQIVRRGLTQSSKYAPMRVFLSSDAADMKVDNGNMRFNFRQDISVTNDTDIYVSLDQFTVANTEYNVNKFNQNIYLVQGAVQNNVQTPVNVSLTLVEGNYTVRSLLTHIQALIAADTVASPIFAVSFNDSTNKFTFSSTNMAYKFKLYGGGRNSTTNYKNSALQLLGFNFSDVNGHESTLPQGGTTNTLTSEKQADLSGLNSFYFSVSSIHTGNVNFVQSNQGRSSSILQCIQMQADVSSINFYSNTSGFKSRIFDRLLTHISVQLYDEDYMPWNPTSKWTACLEISFYDAL